MNLVRSALIQARATPDKESMVQKHLAMLDEAASKGAQIACFQELFFGPYFCQVIDKKWYDYAEPIPGPTVSRLQEAARKHRMVIIAPIYEVVDAGVYYNSAAVIDADGSLLGVYRKNHIPYAPGGHEKFYFKPGNLGYPVFHTAYARIGVLICYDRQFPEGARILGLRGAQIVYIPAATWRGLVDHLWFIGQRAHAAANGYFVGTLNRISGEAELGPVDFYGSSYFCDPRGTIITQASDSEEEVLVADLDLGIIKEARDDLPLYRDRRPETYHDIIEFIP